MEFATRMAIALKNSGLSDLEENLIGMLRSASYPRAGLVEVIAGSQKSVDSVVSALDVCFKRGLIQVVTPEMIELDAERWASDPMPRCDFDFWQAGELAMTESGYWAWRRAQDIIKGTVRTGMAGDIATHTISIYSQLYDMCWEHYLKATDLVHFFRQGKDGKTFEFGPKQIYRSHRPNPIGTWRISRYEIVPDGYVAKIIYDGGAMD